MIHSIARSAPDDPTVFEWARFRASREELAKARDWEPGKGKPPLSRNEALEIARKAAQAAGLQLPDKTRWLVELSRPLQDEDEIRKQLPKNVSLWFYVVTFGDSPAGRFVVTMSGTLAEREITRK